MIRSCFSTVQSGKPQQIQSTTSYPVSTWASHGNLTSWIHLYPLEGLSHLSCYSGRIPLYYKCCRLLSCRHLRSSANVQGRPPAHLAFIGKVQIKASCEWCTLCKEWLCCDLSGAPPLWRELSCQLTWWIRAACASGAAVEAAIPKYCQRTRFFLTFPRWRLFYSWALFMFLGRKKNIGSF